MRETRPDRRNVKQNSHIKVFIASLLLFIPLIGTAEPEFKDNTHEQLLVVYCYNVYVVDESRLPRLDPSTSIGKIFKQDRNRIIHAINTLEPYYFRIKKAAKARNDGWIIMNAIKEGKSERARHEALFGSELYSVESSIISDACIQLVDKLNR